MGSKFLTDLADVLRGAGLDVVEYSGWRTRARGSGGYDGNRPWCVMWHHTASSVGWDGQRDADYIATGDPSAPLANLYIERSGRVWVLAAGATNTNGKGGPVTMSRGTVPLDSMNTHAIGVEMGNTGVGEAWPCPQIDAMFATSIACCAAYGLAPTDCCTHNVWSPNRKIDPATAAAVQGPWQPHATNHAGTWALDDIRAECARRAAGIPPEPEEDMAVIELWQLPDNPAVYIVDITHGGKLWLPTGQAVAQRQALAQMYGQDPELKIQHDRDMFRAYGPILGPAPGGVDEYGIPH